MKAWILYENEDWLAPLEDALDAEGVAYELRFVDGGVVPLDQAPEPGVYINRMSPSSHTRGHQAGVQFMREYLPYLESWGRPIINGSRAFELEVSKVQQDIALRNHGIRTPRTRGVVGRDALIQVAQHFETPFITKHNQGGKGLGIRLFENRDGFEAYVRGELEDDPGGVFLIQEYIRPAEPFITRVELVAGEFQYAIKSSTAGGFELCPAQACQVSDAHCPVGEDSKFALREDFDASDPLVSKLVALMEDYGLDVAGIEFVEDATGERYVYDINGTTNYNAAIEAAQSSPAMQSFARLVKRKLEGLA